MLIDIQAAESLGLRLEGGAYEVSLNDEAFAVIEGRLPDGFHVVDIGQQALAACGIDCIPVPQQCGPCIDAPSEKVRVSPLSTQ